MIKFVTSSKSATAGNSIGIYCFEVPSSLTAPVAIKISPFFTDFSTDPDVPILIKTSAPICANSSTAIAVEGHPIPVETTETSTPLYLPLAALNSLLLP